MEIKREGTEYKKKYGNVERRWGLGEFAKQKLLKKTNNCSS